MSVRAWVRVCGYACVCLGAERNVYVRVTPCARMYACTCVSLRARKCTCRHVCKSTRVCARMRACLCLRRRCVCVSLDVDACVGVCGSTRAHALHRARRGNAQNTRTHYAQMHARRRTIMRTLEMCDARTTNVPTQVQRGVAPPMKICSEKRACKMFKISTPKDAPKN